MDGVLGININEINKQDRKKNLSSFFLQGKRKGDKIFHGLVIAAACYTLLMILIVVFSVGNGSKDVFLKEGFFGFLTGTDWNSVEGRESYGALPYIIGTLISSALAMAIGVPVSFGIAIFLSEMASTKISVPLSFVVE
ncbi:MAG: hypothetical protein ACJ71C_05260, partial [Nitrososphaeraceae archaeon]